MNRPDYDPRTRTARVGGRAVRLTEKEGGAFELLCDRIGETVRRDELEQTVWGMRPGAQSETVPVTVRALRRKLSWTGSFPLETVRGVGWRLHPLPAPPTSLPRFGAPFHPRPAEQERLTTLLTDGWSVVTVAGLGGVGKTRLAVAVASNASRPVLFVHVCQGVTVEHLEQSVLTVAGMDAEGLALIDAESIVFLDEAEESWEAVRALVLRYPQLRFLLTSRRPVDVPGEAVLHLHPLAPKEAESFLRHRLRASAWGGDASDASVSRAVELLEGLPLALELAASRPGSLDDLLPRLATEGFPSGPEQERLASTLEASIEALTPDLVQTLQAMALCEGRIGEEALTAWLGPGVVRRVRALASHSLVDHRDGGWSMLRITRTFVRRTEADWSSLRESFHGFLLNSMRGWRRGLYDHPLTTSRQIRALLVDIELYLEVAPIESLGMLVWVLLRHYEMSGPRLGSRRLADLCRRRLGEHPLPRLLEIMQLGQFEKWPEVRPEHDVHVRVLELTTRGFFAPSTFRLADVDALMEAVADDLVLRHRALHGRMFVLRAHGKAQQARDELSALLPLAAHSALMRSELLRWLAMASVDLDIHLSQRLVEDSLALAMPTGMPMVVSRGMWLRDTYLAHSDVRAAADSALEHADRIANSLPRERVLVLGHAGFLLAALGEDETALPLLDLAAGDVSLWCRSHVAATAAAVRVRQDDPSQIDIIRGLELDKVNIQRRDGTSCADQVHAYLLAEIRLYEARQAGRELQEMRAIVAEREAALHEDDEGFCQASLETLRRRLATLSGSA